MYFNLFVLFFRIGAFTFGGGYAMIPLMEQELVHTKKWIKASDILDLFAVAQSIPGAIAINTSTLVGYKLAGKRGALCATLGVILPSFMIILLVASFASHWFELNTVKHFFVGVNGAVLALIGLAAEKLIRASVIDGMTLLFLLGTTLIVVLTDISPIILIILGGFLSLVYYRQRFKPLTSKDRDQGGLK